MKSKENIYDEKIAPLMNQILKICREHKIAMLAQFAIPSESDSELVCTTSLLKPEFEPNDAMIKAINILYAIPMGSVPMESVVLKEE